jgi:hypothetical protein
MSRTKRLTWRGAGARGHGARLLRLRPSPPATESGCFLVSSLIGVSWVKLLHADFRPSTVIAPMCHALLFPVDARPPHDRVRKAWRPNLFHDVGNPSRRDRDTQRDRRAHCPHGNDLGRAVGGAYRVSLVSFSSAVMRLSMSGIPFHVAPGLGTAGPGSETVETAANGIIGWLGR